MADNGTTAAAQPASAPAAQPAAQPAQAPAQQFDPAEFQRLQRIEQQWKGSQPLIEKARGYGLDKPEAFDRYGPVVQHLTKNKIEPTDLLRAFGQVQEENPEQSASLTIKDVEKLVGEKLSAAQKDWIRQQAESERDKEFGGELEALSEDAIAKELGEDLPAELKSVFYHAAMGKHLMDRKPYPDGHPLAGGLGPVGKDGLANIRTYLKDSFTKSLTALQAKQAARIGDAARTRTTTTPAGSTTGQGPSKKEQGPASRRERLEAVAAQHLAKKA